jgi:hypothetical protein
MSFNSPRKKKPRLYCPWYTFSRYEIREGRIVPASDALAKRYNLLRHKDDPSDDRRSRNATKSYARLIQTVTHFLNIDEDDPGSKLWTPISSRRRSKEIEDRILQFTDEFGLLGILHRRYSRIVEPAGPQAWKQSYWQRGDWDPRHRSLWGHTLGLGSAESSSLCIGAPDGYRDATFEAINRTYFGGLSLSSVPRPDSEEFFRIYGEPVDQWIEEAVRLATAIRQDDDQEISALLRVSWTDYVFGPSPATATLTAGSLLEGAALQFIEDYNAGFELRYCDNKTCAARLYYDNDPRSRFCSKKCASTQRQREYRETQKRIKAARKRRRK